MPKLKTKSAMKKRFRIRSGEIIAKKSGKRHNLRKRQTKLNNQKAGYFPIAKSDVGLIKQCLPYGLK